MTVLGKLITGQLDSRGTTIILDSLILPATKLVDHILESSQKKKFILNSEKYITKYPSSKNENYFFDLFSDPKGWNPLPESPVPNCTVCKEIQNLNGLLDLIKKKYETQKVKDQEAILLIDGVNALCLKNEISKVCSFIHQISDIGFNSVIIVVHQDLYNEKEIRMFESISTTFARMLPVDEDVPLKFTNYDGRLKYIQKRKFKVSHNTEYFKVSKTGNVTVTAPPKKARIIVDEDLTKKQIENQLDHNNMSDSEKTARDSLILPWHHTAGMDPITYVEEEEEDPDDDLDI